MFRTSVIKNSKRKKEDRILGKTVLECSIHRPDERTMPYFDVVPEQVLSDERYLSLNNQQQGAFWRLMIHVFAPDRGKVVRHPGMIAQRLRIEEDAWNELETVLLDAGLLVVTQDEIFLLQHEFREQYLQTLKSTNAMRRS